MRETKVERTTDETEIEVTLIIDGNGANDISTGIGFLDHMLKQIAVHGLFDMNVRTRGDLHIDAHHTIEDTALSLGKAFDQALGDRKGIVRMGVGCVPMDEALAHVAVDLAGRPYAVMNAQWHTSAIGDFPTHLVAHFFESLAVTMRANLHARVLYGSDDHHQAEALFKSLARALDAATQRDSRRGEVIPSTKGML